MRGAEPLIEDLVLDGDGAEEEIAVATDVLSEGLHVDVDTVSKGVEVDSRSPSIVENYERAGFVGSIGDSGDVLDFHGDGARTFAPNEARIFLEQRGDVRADGRYFRGPEYDHRILGTRN